MLSLRYAFVSAYGVLKQVQHDELIKDFSPKKSKNNLRIKDTYLYLCEINAKAK
jgi:hypothetical protein